jgi:ribosomal protein L14E/L6E/L27E
MVWNYISLFFLATGINAVKPIPIRKIKTTKSSGISVKLIIPKSNPKIESNI